MTFDKDAYQQAIEPYLVIDPEHARGNIRTVRELSLTAAAAIKTYAYFVIPAPEVSAALLEQASRTNEAVAWLATKLSLDNELGCWELPLVAEYDSKNRAHYPQLSNTKYGARSELAHRFVIRRLFGVELIRADHWDHLERNHACCNPTHGEIVHPKTNNARLGLAATHTNGMDTLFEI